MWVPPSQSSAPNVEPLTSPNKKTLAQSAERKALKLGVVGSSVTLGASRGGAWRACEMSDSEGAFFRAGCVQALKRNPHGIINRLAARLWPTGDRPQLKALRTTASERSREDVTWTTTAKGFEAMRTEPNGTRIHLLHCSDTLSHEHASPLMSLRVTCRRGSRRRDCHRSAWP